MLAPSVANMAFLLGQARFPWWRNWSGNCAIVASGQSAKASVVEKLKGAMPVLAVKQGVDLCPWADAVYGCDAPWWRYRLGLPKFNGLKLRWAGNDCNDYSDVLGITIKDKQLDRILVDEPGVIGSGRNSGFQALNIAVQFGAKRIILIGFDMQGEHFYGRNNWAMANNPSVWNFPRWISAFNTAAGDLKAMGVEVANCSMQSALTCFQKTSVEQALKVWGR